MKKGYYVFIEFHVDAASEEDAIERIRGVLDSQVYSWALTEVEYEEGDE
jgi:hypothetical protein